MISDEELDRYKIELIPPKKRLISNKNIVHVVLLVWNLWNILDFQSSEMTMLDLIWMWHRWLVGFTVIMIIVAVLDWRIKRFRI